MSDQWDDIRADIKELVKQGAIHNELLRTHEARSLALQADQDKIKQALEPIKQHVATVNTGAKWIGAVSVGAAVQWIVRHWL